MILSSILCLSRPSVVVLVLPPDTEGFLDHLVFSYIVYLVDLAPCWARPRSTPSPY